MSELSSFIFAVLQLFLWAVLLYFGFWWLISRFFPKAKWLRQIQKKMLRLMLIEPVRKPYQAATWLLTRAFTVERQYRLKQLYLENYPATPLAFYNAVEEVLAQRQIIGIEILRIAQREWHLLSARRIYLLVRFREAVCFISAVPLGTSFLVSWRYTAQPGKFFLIFFQIPFIGVATEKLLKPATFYRADVYHAFEQVIRSTVLEAANFLTAEEGIRPLTDNEQRPLLREFYG